MADSADIMRVVESVLGAGVTKDMAALRRAYLDDPRFSGFGDAPPYGLRDYGQAMLHEELRVAGISDYSYEVLEHRISVFGDAAVAALRLVQRGMLVDNKSFTGRSVSAECRATFVLVRCPEWRVAHAHVSRAG